MAFLLFNTSGVVKKITRSSQKTGQVVPNLGLAEYLIRNKSADGDVLDDPTQNYIRCKLEDPEEKRLRGIHDLMRTARERVATSKDYLEKTHSAVDRSFDKLRLFTQAPSGWLRDLCTQPKELEGLTLSLEPMFTATTGQFDNDEDSADIVVQTAKPKRRADYREWAVHLPDSLSAPTEDYSTWKTKSYSKPILKNYHKCTAVVNDREPKTSSAGTGNENTQGNCCNDSKTSYDEANSWSKSAKTSYDEDCSWNKTMTSYDELKEASEEKLLLQLCVDEFVIPPRLTVREIRVKDVSITSTESETKTCRNSPQQRETGILSLGSDRSRYRRASLQRRKSLDDQSSNGSYQHRPQPHRCLNRQCRSDCHLRRLLQQEEEEEDKQAEEQEGGGGGKGGGQQLHHQHHQKQQQEKVKSPEQQQRQHLQKNQQDKDKSQQQRQQQQQQHQQKHHQEKDKSQQHHHHPHHQHKQEQHHQNHKQEKEKPQQQLHHEHHQTHQQEKEKSQQRHHQHQQQQQHQSENEKSTQQQQQYHQRHSKPDQQEKEKSQHHHHQQQQQQQHHQQETEKSTQQQQQQYHQRHSKPDQQEKEKSQQQQQHQQQYHQHHEKQKQEKEKSQQQQQQNHHHQLQKQENEKPSHHHQLQDKKIVRVSSTASVPEQNAKRAFIKGQYIDAHTHELADFMLFIYREEEPCAACIDCVEDSRETNDHDDVGKHCRSSRHTHQHQHRTMLSGTYQRKMKTTDKYIRWKFSCPVALRNE